MIIIKLEKQIPSKGNNFAIIDNKITKKGGIYFIYNENLELIYIGKTKSIRQRLVQHFSDKSIRWGEFENYPGITPLEKNEAKYYSYIEIENEEERNLKEVLLVSIIKTKYNSRH